MKRTKLLEIFKNREAIWEGLRNRVFKQEHIEALNEERIEVCMDCSFYKEKGPNMCSLPGTGPCCPECGCSLAIKLRSPSASCPHGFWKAVMTEQESQLLNINLNDKSKERGNRIEDNKSDIQGSYETSEG